MLHAYGSNILCTSTFSFLAVGAITKPVFEDANFQHTNR